MIPAQLKMFLPMVIMWGYNKVGQEWPADILRIAYGASQLLALVSALYISSRINAVASKTEKVTCKTKQPTGPEKVETLSVRDYDLKEVKGNLGRLFMGAAFVIGLHSWKGYLQPLVIQAVMGVILLVEDPLFRIYVLGQPAQGALKRPFKKEVSPFAQLLGQEQKPEAAAEGAEEAEEEDTDGAASADGNGRAVAPKKQTKKTK